LTLNAKCLGEGHGGSATSGGQLPMGGVPARVGGRGACTNVRLLKTAILNTPIRPVNCANWRTFPC